MNWYKKAQFDYPYSLLEIIQMQPNQELPISTMNFYELKEAKELEEHGFIKKKINQDKQGKYTVYIISPEKFKQMGWKIAATNINDEDTYEKLALSDKYYYRGTNNLNEINSIIKRGKFIPSFDTIAGDPVLEEEYGEMELAPEWAYDKGVNFTTDFFNAEGYGVFVIVAKPKQNARMYFATDIHTQIHVDDIIPVAILHSRDYAINKKLKPIKWINKNELV